VYTSAKAVLPWSGSPPKFNHFSLAHCQPFLKISSKHVRTFLRIVANRQTNDDDYISSLADVIMRTGITMKCIYCIRHKVTSRRGCAAVGSTCASMKVSGKRCRSHSPRRDETVQPPRSTRSSSLVTLARPPTSFLLPIRSFGHSSACLRNHLPAVLRQPHPSTLPIWLNFVNSSCTCHVIFLCSFTCTLNNP